MSRTKRKDGPQYVYRGMEIELPDDQGEMMRFKVDPGNTIRARRVYMRHRGKWLRVHDLTLKNIVLNELNERETKRKIAEATAKIVANMTAFERLRAAARNLWLAIHDGLVDDWRWLKLKLKGIVK